MTVLLCRICPPTVLNWPLKPTPVVRWMTIVTESAVIAPVLFSRTFVVPGRVGVDCRCDSHSAIAAAAALVHREADRRRPRQSSVNPGHGDCRRPERRRARRGRVRRLLPPVAGFGLKLAVTPAGNPLAVKETPAVKPPVRVIVIVLVPLAPRLIVKLAGFAESVKSGVGTSLW